LRQDLPQTRRQHWIGEQVVQDRLPMANHLGIQVQLTKRLADEVVALLESDA
jgi:hypothetical protein